jgi:GTP cyclohydrolase IA
MGVPVEECPVPFDDGTEPFYDGSIHPRRQEVLSTPPGHFWLGEGGVGVPRPFAHVAEEAVRTLLRLVGEDPNRDGLKDTPSRVVRALTEMTDGCLADPATILAKTFKETHDEMIIVDGIEFSSLCEHHLLPFSGTVDIGYLPGKVGKVVGLSKLPRLVECFAKRLQIQERMTRQIAEAIETHLSAEGVAVIISAYHSCMGCRGVRKPRARMRTSAMLGRLRDNPAARAEFLALIRGRG